MYTYVGGQVFKAILHFTAEVEDGTHHLKGRGHQGTEVAIVLVLDHSLVPGQVRVHVAIYNSDGWRPYILYLSQIH